MKRPTLDNLPVGRSLPSAPGNRSDDAAAAEAEDHRQRCARWRAGGLRVVGPLRRAGRGVTGFLSARQAVQRVPALNPAGGKLLGVQAPGAPDALGPVQTFAASAGAHPNLIGEYMAWNKPMDTQAAANAWSYGALYYMVWEPYDTSVAAIAAAAATPTSPASRGR